MLKPGAHFIIAVQATKLAAVTKNPAQFVGLHFFNPVPLMKIVEVVRSILTDDATVAAAYEWVQAVGKVPVRAKDSTAFIVNRLLVPYLLDAIRVYEGGLATLEDQDPIHHPAPPDREVGRGDPGVADGPSDRHARLTGQRAPDARSSLGRPLSIK